MRSTLFLAALLGLSAAQRPATIDFGVPRMLDPGANETCALVDVNRDGRLDIVSGENWYEAPTWKQHRWRDLHYENSYIDAFSDLPLDVDGDGWTDIVTATWFSRKLSWFKNPGKAGGAAWKEQTIESGAPIEFAFLVDLDNDGKAQEVLPQFGNAKQPLAWYAVRNGKWEKQVVSQQSYGHGIGAGDVNGDGKADILTPKGWFEAPNWNHHADWNETAHLSFMHVLDVNGDGRRDVVYSNAHDYGIFWLEQGAEPGKWAKRVIDDSWSQGHALTLVDLNGDKFPEIVTGKRYMAHNGKDPGEKEPLGIYYYQMTKTDKGAVQWVRHVVDYGSRTGGGMQIPVADLDGDGDLDFVTPGKSGLFLFTNKTK